MTLEVWRERRDGDVDLEDIGTRGCLKLCVNEVTRESERDLGWDIVRCQRLKIG